MSKAEERGKTYALHKASEKLNDYYGNAMLSVVQFDGCDIKNAYIEGYHQAEKDNELTWEDMQLICEIEFSICYYEYKDKKLPPKEQIYKEILKRFKERKEK